MSSKDVTWCTTCNSPSTVADILQELQTVGESVFNFHLCKEFVTQFQPSLNGNSKMLFQIVAPLTRLSLGPESL